MLRNVQNPKQQFTNHLAWTSDDPIGFEVDRAAGSYIYLKDGRRIIDLISELPFHP